MRTSQTHPLQIADVEVGPGWGHLGVMFCPGKIQPDAATGAWRRDLALDLNVITRWGATAVVTLIDNGEMERLGVADLGAQIEGCGIAWYHLPIRNVSVPGPAFEYQWRRAGEQLRDRLRAGFNVLVHCNGSFGRAGVVAARLLVELGWAPGEAMAQVRRVRPGTIGTTAQERHVQAQGLVPEPLPGKIFEDMHDRAVGALLGLAVGDAVGTTLEFSARDSKPPLTDMIGGGPFRLKAGEWTDDTAMALALADSLETCDGLDEADLMRRLVRWHEDGAYSCTGTCFDIGATTRAALTRWKRSGDPVAGSTDPASAGNGSLMRLAPVAIRFFHDAKRRRDAAERQSRVTHAAPQAVAACAAFADIVAAAIDGCPRSELLAGRPREGCEVIDAILQGSWRGKRRAAVRASGYVAHSLEAALWCVGRTTSFADAVLLAANLGEDADTTAAITGQLAGAIYGVSAIPLEWRARVALGSRIEAMAGRLYAAALPGHRHGR